MTDKLRMFSKSFKTVNILLHIFHKRKIIIRRISIDLNITYRHTRYVIEVLEKNKLIKIDMLGRKKELSLTEKGEEIAIRFEEIKNLIEKND